MEGGEGEGKKHWECLGGGWGEGIMFRKRRR